MFKSFTIERFRGVSRCELKDLRRITLLTGRNNVGKSAVLEALFIHSGNYNPNLVMVVNALRGVGTVAVDGSRQSGSPWRSIFADYDDTQPVRLTGEIAVRHRTCSSAPSFAPSVVVCFGQLALDGIQLYEEAQRLLADGAAMVRPQLVELVPRMCHAAHHGHAEFESGLVAAGVVGDEPALPAGVLTGAGQTEEAEHMLAS